MNTFAKTNLNTISIFTGAGGLDIGFERAGFSTKYAVEIVPEYCETLITNKRKHIHIDTFSNRFYFENCTIINNDISTINSEQLNPDFIPIDCLIGGPPCQSFSSAGKQQSIFDKRGALIYEYFRILNELKPKTFLFENVRGLVTAKGNNTEPGEILVHLLKLFSDAGYNCRVSLLNSADYGSYQRRVRYFILGSKIGAAPMFPDTQYSETGNNSLLSSTLRKKWRTLKDFLALYEDKNRDHWVLPTPSLLEQLKNIPDGKGLRSNGRIEATRPSGHWGYRQGTFIADQTKPARTVTGSSSQDWIRTSDGILRRLTLKEIAALQGFPQEWEFCGKKSAQFQQIGNAVPTIFGYILGKTISEYILGGYKNYPESNSTELPQNILESIRYTKYDNAKNGAYRANNFHIVHSVK